MFAGLQEVGMQRGAALQEVAGRVAGRAVQAGLAVQAPTGVGVRVAAEVKKL